MAPLKRQVRATLTRALEASAVPPEIKAIDDPRTHAARGLLEDSRRMLKALVVLGDSTPGGGRVAGAQPATPRPAASEAEPGIPPSAPSAGVTWDWRHILNANGLSFV